MGHNDQRTLGRSSRMKCLDLKRCLGDLAWYRKRGIESRQEHIHPTSLELVATTEPRPVPLTEVSRQDWMRSSEGSDLDYSVGHRPEGQHGGMKWKARPGKGDISRHSPVGPTILPHTFASPVFQPSLSYPMTIKSMDLVDRDANLNTHTQRHLFPLASR